MVIRQNTRACLLALVSLLVVECQTESPVSVTPAPATSASSPQPTPALRAIGAEDAVRAALQSSIFRGRSAPSDLFPVAPGSRDCDIRGGGPDPGIVVPGICRTEVTAAASGYVVRFTETWDASRFHLAGEASSGQLTSTWSFTVSSIGTVVDQSQSGNFPPQYVK
jgi:hypothetical protein